MTALPVLYAVAYCGKCVVESTLVAAFSVAFLAVFATSIVSGHRQVGAAA